MTTIFWPLSAPFARFSIVPDAWCMAWLWTKLPTSLPCPSNLFYLLFLVRFIKIHPQSKLLSKNSFYKIASVVSYVFERALEEACAQRSVRSKIACAQKRVRSEKRAHKEACAQRSVRSKKRALKEAYAQRNVRSKKRALKEACAQKSVRSKKRALFDDYNTLRISLQSQHST